MKIIALAVLFALTGCATVQPGATGATPDLIPAQSEIALSGSYKGVKLTLSYAL